MYVGSRDIEKGKAVLKELKDNGFENLQAVEIDVTKPDTISSARNIIENELGHSDILINNAGISGIVPQSALETSIQEHKEIFDVNLYSVVDVTQTFIPLLKKSPAPRIVNVSTSVGSLTLQRNPNWPAYEYAKYAVYGASKSAMNMYTVHLGYELRETAFKVNAVCPGIQKPILPTITEVKSRGSRKTHNKIRFN